MKILALDYGSAHTGVAISDPTGSIVRPLDDINDAISEDGTAAIARLVEEEEVHHVVVGLPVTLKGEKGEQAGVTENFIMALQKRLSIPVLTWDERFTSKLAADKGPHSNASEHSLAACVLLEDYLGSRDFQSAEDDPEGSQD